jgi:hypothetical protein
MLTIKKNDSPNMAICKMNCDDGLHEKLNKYELTSFMNSHTTQLLIGKPRSGKTSLLYSLFKSSHLFKKTYHNIFIFQPSASRASMKDQLFNQLPPEQLYEELTLENLSSVMSVIKSEHADDNNCIIFDDQTAYLKNKDTLQLLKEMIFNRRHLHLSIYFLVQTYYSVPREIRRMFSNIFVFKTSKDEIENIFDEVIETGDKHLSQKVSKMVFDKPYEYLFINTDSQRMFKKFDEIIIPQ